MIERTYFNIVCVSVVAEKVHQRERVAHNSLPGVAKHLVNFVSFYVTHF